MKYKIIIIISITLLIISNIITYKLSSKQDTKIVTKTEFFTDSIQIKVLRDSLKYLEASKINVKLSIKYVHDTLGNTIITYDSIALKTDTITYTKVAHDSLYVKDTIYIKDSVYMTASSVEKKWEVDGGVFIDHGINLDRNFDYGAKIGLKYFICNPIYIEAYTQKSGFTDNKNWKAGLSTGISF